MPIMSKLPIGATSRTHDAPRALSQVREFTSVVGLIILVPLWWGCAPRTQMATSAPTAQARPRSTATVAILSPAPGGAVTGTTLHVKLGLAGQALDPPTPTHTISHTCHNSFDLSGIA